MTAQPPGALGISSSEMWPTSSWQYISIGMSAERCRPGGYESSSFCDPLFEFG